MASLWFASFVLAFGGAMGCTGLFALATHPSAPLGFHVDGNPAFPPLLGGLAVLLGTVAAIWVLGLAAPTRHLVLGMCLIFAAGLVSDLSQQRPVALLGQAVVTLLVASAGNLEFAGLGAVTFPGLGLALAVAAIFAITRAINGLADLPGFRAAYTFVALTWFVFAAAMSGHDVAFRMAIVLQAALGGYLVCNFVLLGKPFRHVFLGSSGGLMIAFAVGWLALVLTQGNGRSFPVYAALWVLYLPLADWCSVLLRRIARREDLFERSEKHLHHYLKLHGLKTAQIFAVMLLLSGLCALFGFAGWRFGVPPALMYLLAGVLFVAYHVWITRAWKRVTGYVVFTQ